MGMIATWIYVFLVFVTSDSFMLLVASAILFVGFLMSNRKKNKLLLKGNTYFYVELIFIVYCLFQITVGIAVLKDVSWSTTQRLLLNCIDELLLFNILIRFDDIEDIYKSLIFPYVTGCILIMYLRLRSGSLFLNRLTTGMEEGASYKFLGLTINAGAATIIGHCAVCAFAFCIIYYFGSRKKKYLIFASIASLGLVLSSSRKALMVAVALIVIIPEFREHNSKKLQRIIGSITLIIVGVVLILRIPALYDLVGIRLERMFIVLRTGQSVDYSMNVRSNLSVIAWDAFMLRPIEGWGVNSFKQLFNDGWIYSHSNYLELLVGTGVIGTIVFLSKYVYILRRVILCMKTKNEVNKFYCKSLLIWLIMVWVMEYWQVSYYNERMIVHFIFVLALLEKMKKDDVRLMVNCLQPIQLTSRN